MRVIVDDLFCVLDDCIVCFDCKKRKVLTIIYKKGIMTFKEFLKKKGICKIGVESERIVIADGFTLELKAYLARRKEFKIGGKELKEKLEKMMSTPSSEK